MKFNFKDFFQNIKSKMTKRHALVAGVIGLALVIAVTAICITFCGDGGSYTPTEKTYTVALAVDTTVGQDNKVTNYVAALILDENNKIVAARIDCAETTPSVVDGAIADVNSVLSKVELGDDYKMDSGSFAQQTKAFEDAIVGKTADEVANLDMTLVTGCTMPYSPASFKAVVAKAFASTNKNTFKTAATFTFGLDVDMSISGDKVTTYYAATAVVCGGVAANIIDCNEIAFTVAEGVAVAGDYNGTKVELGDDYKMTAGTFAQQTKAFEDAIVGKTSDEIANLDMALVTGCTMPYSPISFKAVVANAITNAR